MLPVVDDDTFHKCPGIWTGAERMGRDVEMTSIEFGVPEGQPPSFSDNPTRAISTGITDLVAFELRAARLEWMKLALE